MTTIPQEIRKYELMVILSGDMTEADQEKELAELRSLLKEHTKAVSFEDIWGKRDFTYRMRRQKRGYYVVFNFNAAAEAILELRQTVKLNPHVLRHMLISVPEDYVSVRHADMMAAVARAKAEEKRPRRTDGRERVSSLQPREFAQAPAPAALATAPAAPIEEQLKPKVAGKAEEEKLKSVEKKLEEILENPDIDIR